MRLTVAAVGRLRDGPERRLVDDYLARCSATGRGIGLGPATVVEVDERKARAPEVQAERLLALAPGGAALLALDQRGETMSSEGLAALIARLRDAGRAEAVFLIGGADGHGPAVPERAERLISFGPMVWPHMLARVMLSEQLYRAVSILAGTPYHRA